MEDSRFKAVYEQHEQHTVNCVEVAVKQKDMMLELDADVVGGGRCKKVEQTGGLHLMQKVIHLIYLLQVVAGENVARQYHKIVCRMALC